MIDEEDETTAPFVSVVIPVYGNPGGLERCLAALQRQRYPAERFETIVVRDELGETAAAAVCRAFPEVRCLEQPHRGSYAARNRGLAAAAGALIAFTDSDCIPADDWIGAGVRALRSLSRAGLAGGRVEFYFADPPAPTALELYDAMTFLQQERLIARHNFACTANLFAHRAAFDDIGCFEESVRSGGDGEWGNRAVRRGYPLRFAPDAVVRHPARRTFVESRRKWVRVARGFRDLQGKSGYRWADGRSMARQLLWPPLGAKRKAIFADPRAGSVAMKMRVFGVAIAHHYLAEVAHAFDAGA